METSVLIYVKGGMEWSLPARSANRYIACNQWAGDSAKCSFKKAQKA